MLPVCARVRPAALVLLLCALAARAGLAGAVTLPDLYAATVPVAGSGGQAQQEAFRAALGEVLVRVTGRRDAASLAGLAPLLANAASHVVSYRRAAGNRLAVTFDSRALENAIDAAGLPFWGAERPRVLVWLLAGSGGGQSTMVTATSPGEERQRIEQAATRRGLPLAWPGGDDLGAAAAWIGAGDHGRLVAAAERYGADGVLIGQVAAGASAARPVQWSFDGAGTAAEVTGVLETGPDLAADRYAARLATSAAGRRSEELVTITGIDSLEAFAAVERALGRLAPVRGVSLYEVAPDAVSFVLRIRGDPAALAAALQRDAGLRLVDSGRMVFAVGP